MAKRHIPVVAAVFLISGCSDQAKRIAELEKRNQELAAKLEAPSKAATLDLQEKCAKQARAEFKEAGWDKEQLATYVNHYNAKLNKCFMQIENTTPTPSQEFLVTRVLTDAYEGQVYGQYSWRSAKDKKYWEVSPFNCKVTLSSGEERPCHSDDEYKELVRPYLEH